MLRRYKLYRKFRKWIGYPLTQQIIISLKVDLQPMQSDLSDAADSLSMALQAMDARRANTARTSILLQQPLTLPCLANAKKSTETHNDLPDTPNRYPN